MSIQSENLAPWQPCKSPEWTRSQIKHYYKVELGKMLQPAPAKPDDIEVPYLKALHVQWNKVVSEDLPTMWANANDIKHLTVSKGDLLVCEGGEVGRAAIVEEDLPENCIIQNALHLVRPDKKANVRFLFYLLSQASDKDWFDVICNRSTIAHFTVEKFKETWVWIPQIFEQEEIVNYLDRETAHIDNLIEAKENMLTLLAEKRQALITQAVTRGLDPTVRLKPSGVEWLADVPEHWEVKRAKWLFRERDVRTQTGEETLLSLRMDKGLVPHDEVSEKPITDSDLIGYKITHKNDLVINKMRASGGLASVTPFLGLVSPDYSVFEAVERVSPDFYMELFKTNIFKAIFRSVSKGLGTGSSGFLRMYTENFYTVSMSVPPFTEQLEIIEYVENEKTRLNTLHSATEQTITLLKERRSALITAAVTGQIDIPQLHVH